MGLLIIAVYALGNFMLINLFVGVPNPNFMLIYLFVGVPNPNFMLINLFVGVPNPNLTLALTPTLTLTFCQPEFDPRIVHEILSYR